MPSASSSRVAAAVSSITFWVAEFEPRTALVISLTDIPFSEFSGYRRTRLAPFQHECDPFESRLCLDSWNRWTYLRRSHWHSLRVSASSVTRRLVFQCL